MPTTKIEPNYKISIPKEEREALGLQIGQEVDVTFRKVKLSTSYTPTARELRAIQKGREEIKKGNYYTLDEFQTWLMGNPPKKARPKKPQTRATT